MLNVPKAQDVAHSAAGVFPALSALGLISSPAGGPKTFLGTNQKYCKAARTG